ncbi:MAG TPA: hypothetical protein ENN57_02525, partial [Chloroflexi bacterium]|nr:hypothetical protein [Chloroflexota bacterium]
MAASCPTTRLLRLTKANLAMTKMSPDRGVKESFPSLLNEMGSDALLHIFSRAVIRLGEEDFAVLQLLARALKRIEQTSMVGITKDVVEGK